MTELNTCISLHTDQRSEGHQINNSPALSINGQKQAFHLLTNIIRGINRSVQFKRKGANIRFSSPLISNSFLFIYQVWTIFQEKCSVQLMQLGPLPASPLLTRFIDHCDDSRELTASNSKTKPRSDAGALTLQRGQSLCAVATKRWSEPGLQTLSCFKANHRQTTSYLREREEELICARLFFFLQ